MNLNGGQSLWRAGILGVINGLLVGGVASAAIRIYFDYENTEILKAALGEPMLTHFLRTFEPVNYIIIIVFCVSVFTASGLIVHHHLASRVRSVVSLWVCVCLGAVPVGAVFAFVAYSLESVLAGPDKMLRHLIYFSLGFGTLWLLFLAALVVINLIYGSVIRLASAQYSSIR
jgi:hypothetical protein